MKFHKGGGENYGNDRWATRWGGGRTLFFFLVPKLTYFVFDQFSAVCFKEVVKYDNLETKRE